MVLSVFPSPSRSIPYFPGYRPPLRPSMEMVIKWVGWQLEEYKQFHANSYPVIFAQLNVLERLPLLECGQWIKEEQD